MSSATQQLPDDVAALKALVAEMGQRLSDKDERIAKLEQLVAQLRKQQFGPRSEKRGHDDHPGQQLFAFPELLDAAQRVAEATGQEGEIEVASHRRKRKGGRRNSFPEHLPHVRTTYELPEDQRTCCGQPMNSIGHDVTRQLERIEVTLVHEIARTKYACKGCGEGVKTAPGPSRPIDKGLLGTGFLAHLAVERFARHMPYYRLEKKYASEGLSLSRSVLCRSTLRCAELLEPIVEQMKTEILAAPIVQTDDTPVRIQVSKQGGPKRGFAWVYKDMDGRHVFDFTESRSRDGPLAFLGDYCGYLQADAYAGYDILYLDGTVIEVACWAHARRRFVDAEGTEPRLAKHVVYLIRKLYAIESRADKEGLTTDAIRELRQRRATPILAQIRDELAVMQRQVLDKSPMGTAIRYAQAQWTALNRYVEDGRLAIDNNLSENALRGIAVGRKNWLFVGHEEAGRKGAVMISLIKTCETIGIDPRTYLADVLTRIAVCSDVAKLTPHGWREHFADEVQARQDRMLQAIAATRG